MLRDHGQAKKYHHDMEGYNGRLDAIQAAILQVKLTHLNDWTRLRRVVAQRYRELLADTSDKVALPSEQAWAKAVYHLFVVRVGNRDALAKYLASVGIATGIHYPTPLHLQNAYKKLGFRIGDFPITERVAQEMLSLPIFPTLHADLQLEIADKIANFLSTVPA
jgi:dTDP-4-amino-4,6-dideoxygalactose transaminase